MPDSPLSDIQIGFITSQWAKSNQLYVNYKKETASTNATAKDEAFQEDLLAEALCLYLADIQTAGRGRGQNHWNTDLQGSALLSSWSFLLDTKPQPTTSCLVGLALYRACTTTWPFLDWNLKAPNDIYIGARKIAGILIENVVQDDETRLIVGIGLNVLASPKTETPATSIVESLPKGAPLLGEDYMAFLDRLLLELTDVASRCQEALTSTDQYALLTALNKHPLLKEKYIGMKAEGSLVTETKIINWMEL